MPETKPNLSGGVPSFDGVGELRAAMQDKADFINRDLYPRDGSSTLGEIESQLAKIIEVEDGQALAYSSGMSAATAAVDVALHVAQSSRPSLTCARETYSQSKRYVENFINPFRAKVSFIDTGEVEDLESKLRNPDTDVLLAETVSNYQNMPVLDVYHLLDVVRDTKNPPTVVIDNTLPLSTGMPLPELLTPEDKIIVVESGTKSYSFNEETLGVGCTKNEELLDWLRRYRRTRGDLPGGRSQEEILSLLPENREVFDERNRRLFKATAEVAMTLAQRDEQNESSDYLVAHPGLASHYNNQLYVEQYPDGGAPVLYVSSVNPSVDQHKLLDRIWSSPDVRKHAVLGQSFGFDEARIIYDENLSMIRIAGGANTDGKALGEACADALYS